MVKRSENGGLGGLWLQSYGLSVRSEATGRFHRVRRAASSVKLLSEELLVARYSLIKTATLAMVVGLLGRVGHHDDVVEGGRERWAPLLLRGNLHPEHLRHEGRRGV